MGWQWSRRIEMGGSYNIMFCMTFKVYLGGVIKGEDICPRQNRLVALLRRLFFGDYLRFRIYALDNRCCVQVCASNKT